MHPMRLQLALALLAIFATAASARRLTQAENNAAVLKKEDLNGELHLIDPSPPLLSLEGSRAAICAAARMAVRAPSATARTA